MSLEISVVIPTLNSAETIGNCLDAIGKSSAELIVVDDHSSDDTQDIARSRGANVIDVRTKSAAAARNEGVAHSTADIIAFTDSDCIPSPDWTVSIQAAFRELPSADIIGGSIGLREDTAFKRAYRAMYALTDARCLGDSSIMLPAMNLAARARVFKVVRFDETLPGALCDDVDFLQRARTLGLSIRYRPEIKVTHLNPSSFRSFVRQEVRHGMGDLIFSRRYPEIASVRSTDLHTWIAESMLNITGHVRMILMEAGTTNFLTLSAGVLNYLRHVAGGYGHIKARKLATRRSNSSPAHSR